MSATSIDLAPTAPVARPAATAAPTVDWRDALPEWRRRRLRLWLWAIAAATASVLIVGGITRLTHSGLSIVPASATTAWPLTLSLPS